MARPMADGTLAFCLTTRPYPPVHTFAFDKKSSHLQKHLVPFFYHQPNSLFPSFLPPLPPTSMPLLFSSPSPPPPSLPPPPMPPLNAPRHCARRAPAVPSCTFLFHRPACLPPRVPLDRLAGLILSRLICSDRQQPLPEVGPSLCLAEFSFEQPLQYIDAGGSASFGSTRVRAAGESSVVSD